MIEIKEYEDKYAEAISKIVIQNMLEVNSKDYGIEFCKTNEIQKISNSCIYNSL